MWFKNISIFICVSILAAEFSVAQENPPKTDSTHLYENIETYSKRNKFNTFIYRLIFKPVTHISKKKEPKKKVNKRVIQKPYSAFEGKIIRNIVIVTLDPFGYSATDTSRRTESSLYKAANTLHIKTQQIAIQNLILIRKNQPFDSLLVKESERLIRSQKYVHEVSFFVSQTKKKSDSVDIYIRELDSWSMLPEGAISSSGFNLVLTDKNIIGTGHEFKNQFARDYHRQINAFSTNYFIPNIYNTYISSTMHYGIDNHKNFNKSFTVDRPFYSPFTRWAAGISLSSQSAEDSLNEINAIYVPINLKFKTQDYWAGTAIRLFKGNSEDDRVTNLVLAIRYLHIRYTEKPSELIDPLQIYSNENFYLAGIGISQRKYVQDKYLFRAGVIEDVPIGKIFGVSFGYQVKHTVGRYYLGLNYSSGIYKEWGYLSYNLEYGTFFRNAIAEQGTLNLGLNYFTSLFEIGRWRFRQFVKPQVTFGINRLSFDSLTLNEGYGLDGFKSNILSGINRILLSMQTQSYAPWNLLGFHFGPYLTFTLGMLGYEISGFQNSKVYSQIGLGVLIKNDNFVFNAFQFSVSFYPQIPGYGQNVFKINSFRTTDFGLKDFKIGKPAGAIYQ